MTAPAQVALCIGCECTDTQACPGGCSWLYVDYGIGYGICSSCPEVYEDFVLRVAGDEDADRIEVVQDLDHISGEGG